MKKQKELAESITAAIQDTLKGVGAEPKTLHKAVKKTAGKLAKKLTRVLKKARKKLKKNQKEEIKSKKAGVSPSPPVSPSEGAV